jgi:hypothetical protein
MNKISFISIVGMEPLLESNQFEDQNDNQNLNIFNLNQQNALPNEDSNSAEMDTEEINIDDLLIITDIEEQKQLENESADLLLHIKKDEILQPMNKFLREQNALPNEDSNSAEMETENIEKENYYENLNQQNALPNEDSNSAEMEIDQTDSQNLYIFDAETEKFIINDIWEPLLRYEQNEILQTMDKTLDLNQKNALPNEDSNSAEMETEEVSQGQLFSDEDENFVCNESDTKMREEVKKDLPDLLPNVEQMEVEDTCESHNDESIASTSSEGSRNMNGPIIIQPINEENTKVNNVVYKKRIPQKFIIYNSGEKELELLGVLQPQKKNKMKKENIAQNYFVLFNNEKRKLGVPYSINLPEKSSVELILTFPKFKDIKKIRLNEFNLKFYGSEIPAIEFKFHIGERHNRDRMNREKAKRSVDKLNDIEDMSDIIANNMMDSIDLSRQVPRTIDFTARNDINILITPNKLSFNNNKNLICVKPGSEIYCTVKTSLPLGSHFMRIYIMRNDCEPSQNLKCQNKCKNKNKKPLFECWANGKWNEPVGNQNEIYPNQRFRYEFGLCEKFSIKINCLSSCHLCNSPNPGNIIIEILNNYGLIVARRYFPYKILVRPDRV